MKIEYAFLSLLFAAVCSAGEITNAKSSIVLDGGSFTVTLTAVPKEDGWRLFIANPTRRHTPKEIIQVLDKSEEPKESLDLASPSGKRLHAELTATLKSDRLTLEAKAICEQLDRLLLHPNIPWEEVHFPEKWE